MQSGTKRISKHPAVIATGTKPLGNPSVRLFSGLSDLQVNAIMAAATVRKFMARRIIVRADEPGSNLYLLKTGSINYYRLTPEGRQVLIIRLSPGEAFGLGSLLAHPISYMGTAETLRETEVYSWGHAWIRRFVEKYPILAENALRLGLEYIRLYSDRHLSLVSDSAEARLARMLVLVGSRVGHASPWGLEIHITNEHLASLADVGSFTASRLLQKWERKGAVKKSRGKIVIRHPEKLIV